ncbi:MAG: hypothetical protein EHM90_00435 [Chloroflexi bacterium]|nr:MAG: hypothetical protein EHM90_00435 [Chloroflexota bacterium]
MALITKQHIVDEGIVPSLAAAAASDTFEPGDDTFLEVANGGGGSINVTVVTPGTSGGLAISDQVVAVANGARKFIGPFPSRLYGDPANDGLATVNFSGTTSVTRGCFDLAS